MGFFVSSELYLDNHIIAHICVISTCSHVLERQGLFLGIQKKKNPKQKKPVKIPLLR